MATDIGLKDLSYSDVDGGTATPTVSTTTTPATPGIMGTTIDLLGLDTGNALLPPEIVLRAVMHQTDTTTAQTFSGTPDFDVHAQWLTAAGSGMPHVGDQQSDHVLAVADTITQTIPTGTPYKLGPTNNRIVATKGRYLRLLYNTTEVVGVTVKFGAKIAPVFSRTS